MDPSVTTELQPALAELLAEAAALALPHRPRPNPKVGCVLLDRQGKVAGSGAHVAAGGDHAEVVALAGATTDVEGGTLVVTLEPCVHHGRTPPCVDAIIAAGISTVVVGAIDPDERTAGRGVAVLRDHGMEVMVAPPETSTEWVDPAYFHHRRTGRPFVTLKIAATLDGQAAAADGTSRWITNAAARRDAHRLRSQSDAVMVGAGTVRTDDPRLDVRLGDVEVDQPRPVVVAGSEPLPAGAQVLTRDPLVFGPPGVGAVDVSVPVIEVPAIGGQLDLRHVLTELGARGVVDLLVEGGPTLAWSLLDAGLVQRIVWYTAGKLGGGTGRPALAGSFATVGDAIELGIEEVTQLDGDVKIVARTRTSGTTS